MTLQDFVGIGALALVAYQTWLTRQALKTTDESLSLTRRTIHLETLPRSDTLVHVLIALEGWQKDLAGQILRLDTARLGNINALKEAASRGEKQPNGLIHLPMYESSPGWLQRVYEAGVQHYYEGNGPFIRSLWDDDNDSPKYAAENNYGIDDALANLRERHAWMTELLADLKDLLPEWWLNSPASLSDRDFFDR